MIRREYPVSGIISELERDNLLPAIIFRTSRRQCDTDILKLSRNRYSRLEIRLQLELRDEIQKVMLKYNMPREAVVDHPQYNTLIQTGAGAHHAGQLLIWRILLEELMTRGKLRLMIATGTVAAGVDFPARTVVVSAHSRRGNEGFQVLSSSEFQQMSGRAGRRGKDKVGVCLIAPSPFSDARVLAEVAKKPPEPLHSCYFASPSTTLNLLRYRSVDDLHYTVEKSLATFLDRKAAARLRTDLAEKEKSSKDVGVRSTDDQKKAAKRQRRELRQVEELERRQTDLMQRSLEGLDRLGYVVEGKLTEKGYWAANLCTTLVLEIAEAINDGLLKDCSSSELVALLGSISGDAHKRYLRLKQNPVPSEKYEALQGVLERVAAAYQRPTPSETVVVPDAGLTVALWLQSGTWPEFSGILRLGGVAEGDVARIVSQTSDHLNQIARLTESHPELAARAVEARYLILKPPLSEVLAQV